MVWNFWFVSTEIVALPAGRHDRNVGLPGQLVGGPGEAVAGLVYQLPFFGS
jgi:hypothetical protein